MKQSSTNKAVRIFLIFALLLGGMVSFFASLVLGVGISSPPLLTSIFGALGCALIYFAIRIFRSNQRTQKIPAPRIDPALTQVEDYIRASLARGFTTEIITAQLFAVGWEKSVIQSSFQKIAQSIQSNPSAPQPLLTPFKLVIKILIALLVSLGGASLLFIAVMMLTCGGAGRAGQIFFGCLGLVTLNVFSKTFIQNKKLRVS
jgi:hypothetical protein